MSDISPLVRGHTYHIYNRGINSADIFSEPRNYDYFLDKWFHNTEAVISTYAYCLMKNHFHFLISVKEEEVKVIGKTGKEIVIDPTRQISHCLNGYAQAYNRATIRHGGLFETPFKRKVIDNDTYFCNAVAYIHLNPQKHGFVDDFRDYSYSSYHLHLSDGDIRVNRKGVMDGFGNRKDYVDYHDVYAASGSFQKDLEEDY